MQKKLPVIHSHFLSTVSYNILSDSKVQSMNRNVVSYIRNSLPNSFLKISHPVNIPNIPKVKFNT